MRPLHPAAAGHFVAKVQQESYPMAVVLFASNSYENGDLVMHRDTRRSLVMRRRRRETLVPDVGDVVTSCS